jgi:hypothetical protein
VNITLGLHFNIHYKASIALACNVVFLGLSIFRVQVHPVARIVCDSVVFFPVYVVGTVFLGVFNNGLYTIKSCTMPFNECVALRHEISTAETAAGAMSIAAL